MILRPGKNEFVLKTTVGALIGSYHVNQLSIQVLDGKCELLTEKWPTCRKLKYAVITEPHSFEIVYPEGKATLWAGFPQPIELRIFTGSHQLLKVTIFASEASCCALRTPGQKQTFYTEIP